MKSVAVDVCVLTVREEALSALLVRRPGNRWELPGSRPLAGEALLTHAAGEALARAAGLRGLDLEQLFTFDRPERQQARVAYLGLTSPERHPITPGADAVDVRWMPLHDLPPVSEDVRQVLDVAHERMRSKATYAPVAFRMLPETFSLGELQVVYEAILDTELDARNFRRDLRAAGVVEPVGRARGDRPGRPATLYRHVEGHFAVVARERRLARALGVSEGG